jgi:CO/xanthine dehydrogenase FAD-binding subunit
VDPEADLHGTAEYRKDLTRWLVGRAVARAAASAVA